MSLGKRLCAEGINTLFYSVHLFFEEVNAARASGKYLNLIRKLSKTPVIILDDFGLRAYSHEEATVLMDILEDRYRKGTVIVTSQVNPKAGISSLKTLLLRKQSPIGLQNQVRQLRSEEVLTEIS